MCVCIQGVSQYQRIKDWCNSVCVYTGCHTISEDKGLSVCVCVYRVSQSLGFSIRDCLPGERIKDWYDCVCVSV